MTSGYLPLRMLYGDSNYFANFHANVFIKGAQIGPSLKNLAE